MSLLRKIIIYFWNLSFGEIYRVIFKRNKILIPPSKDFLISKRYSNIMNEYVPYTGEYGKFESSTYTKSYINRHHTYFHELGVFRWRGLQENLSLVLPLVTDSTKIVIDFGGAGCPLGINSFLIDRLHRDISGKKILHHSLLEFGKKADVIFACHVFEHIENLDKILSEIKSVLNPEGYLICMVPSFSNKFWNAGLHKNELFGGHKWTLGLSETERDVIKDYPYYMDIDSKLEEFFKIERKEYCGDDSIFILAKNIK